MNLEDVPMALDRQVTVFLRVHNRGREAGRHVVEAKRMFGGRVVEYGVMSTVKSKKEVE